MKSIEINIIQKTVHFDKKREWLMYQKGQWARSLRELIVDANDHKIHHSKTESNQAEEESKEASI